MSERIKQDINQQTPIPIISVEGMKKFFIEGTKKSRGYLQAGGWEKVEFYDYEGDEAGGWHTNILRSNKRRVADFLKKIINKNVFDIKIFEKQIERFQQGEDYDILEGENEKKIYLLFSESLVKTCLGEEFDSSFDYKVEVNENNSSFRIYKNSAYQKDKSWKPDYRLCAPVSSLSREGGGSSTSEEFVIGTKIVTSPDGEVISNNNYARFSKYEKGKVVEEREVNLDEPFFSIARKREKWKSNKGNN